MMLILSKLLKIKDKLFFQIYSSTLAAISFIFISIFIHVCRFLLHSFVTQIIKVNSTYKY